MCAYVTLAPYHKVLNFPKVDQGLNLTLARFWEVFVFMGDIHPVF